MKERNKQGRGLMLNRETTKKRNILGCFFGLGTSASNLFFVHAISNLYSRVASF